MIIDGVPARLKLTEADIQPQLDRRRPGQSAIATKRNEADQVQILSGTEFGLTLGVHSVQRICLHNQRSQVSKDCNLNWFQQVHQWVAKLTTRINDLKTTPLPWSASMCCDIVVLPRRFASPCLFPLPAQGEGDDKKRKREDETNGAPDYFASPKVQLSFWPDGVSE